MSCRSLAQPGWVTVLAFILVGCSSHNDTPAKNHDGSFEHDLDTGAGSDARTPTETGLDLAQATLDAARDGLSALEAASDGPSSAVDTNSADLPLGSDGVVESPWSDQASPSDQGPPADVPASDLPGQADRWIAESPSGNGPGDRAGDPSPSSDRGDAEARDAAAADLPILQPIDGGSESSGADCSWSATGECQPGDVETRACGARLGACRAGTQSRTCTSACIWGFWSPCGGDYVGPSPETCGDGIDNNCNGATDEGCACQPVPAGASASFAVAGTISKLVADPSGCLMYGLNTATPSELVIFDTAQKQEKLRIDLGALATDFDLSPDGTHLIVALDKLKQISVVDKSSWTVSSVPTVAVPVKLEVSNDGLAYYTGPGSYADLHRVDLGVGLTSDNKIGGPSVNYPDLELSADGTRLLLAASGSTSCNIFSADVTGDSATTTGQSRWDGGYGFSLPARYAYLGPSGKHIYYAGYQLDATNLALVLGKSGKVFAEDTAATFAVSTTGVLDAELLTYLAAYLDPISAAALTAVDTELWYFSSSTGRMTYVNVADFLGGKVLGVHEAAPDPIGTYTFARLVADPKRPRLYGLDVDRRAVVSIDRASGEALRSVMVGSTPTDIAIDSAGTSLYAGNQDSLALSQIDLQSFAFVRLLTTPRVNQSLVPLSNNRIATIDYWEWTTPTLFDLSTAKVLDYVFEVPYEGVMAATADGNTLFVGDGPITHAVIRRYDVTTGRMQEVAKSKYDPANGYYGFPTGSPRVAVTPDGKSVFYAGNCVDGTNLTDLRYPLDDVISSITPDGRLAISATRVYRVTDGAGLAALPTNCAVQALSPDGTTLYCASDGTIHRIDLRGLD
jgi:DNA-binding beta-propeller fold protein YncE